MPRNLAGSCLPLFPMLCSLVLGGASAQRPPITKEDPFFVSIRKGDVVSVRKALDMGESANKRESLTSLPNVAGNDPGGRVYLGDTALLAAAASSRLDVVKLLIARGADLDGRGSYGYTPLMEASRRGSHAIVQYLLAKGAKVDLINDQGNTALIFAANGGYDAIVSSLLAKGANPNLSQGWTPLMDAAYGGRLSTVKLLLKKGADPNLHPQGAMTPLECARSQGNSEVETALLRVGAKGRTAKQLEAASLKAVVPLLEITQKASLSDDDKRVISLALEEVIRQKRQTRPDASSFLHVFEKTALFGAVLEGQLDSDLREKASEVPLDLRRSLFSRNGERKLLKGLTLSSPPILLIPDETNRGERWNSKAIYAQISLPGYSSNGQTAIVRCWMGPSTHGETLTVLLEKRDGAWQIKWTRVARYV